MQANFGSLGFWIDLWNTQQIRVSFSTVCTLYVRPLEIFPPSSAMSKRIPMSGHDAKQLSTVQKQREQILGLHEWAMSEDGIRIRQRIAHILAKRFDPDCWQRLVSALC
jgi:hypothetical protein